MIRQLVLGGVAALLAAGNAVAANDRFKATAPDMGAGEGSELRTPLQFEEEAANNPLRGRQILFSRCRRAPFTNPNLYSPLAAPEHDAIVGDTSFAFADGSTCFNPQNEQNIVVNPANANHIVTSANEYRYDGHAVYVSTDRGVTWTNVTLPGWTGATGGAGIFAHLDSCGDPVLAFSPDGSRLYYAGLVCNFDKFPRQISGVAVAASLDGGAHWDAPVMVSSTASGDFFQDKEWIGVGNDGTVFLTWTRFYQGARGLGYLRSPIVMASSKTGGKSWSSVKQVSDDAHPFNQGSQVAMAPDGTLYVAYEGATPASGYNHDALIVARSVDGGKNFSNTEVARAFDDIDCYPIQLPG
ncbi:MAG: exo-alpha-sialidase, partial [Betaproteobacteria bacterium]